MLIREIAINYSYVKLRWMNSELAGYGRRMSNFWFRPRSNTCYLFFPYTTWRFSRLPLILYFLYLLLLLQYREQTRTSLKCGITRLKTTLKSPIIFHASKIDFEKVQSQLGGSCDDTWASTELCFVRAHENFPSARSSISESTSHSLLS